MGKSVNQLFDEIEKLIPLHERIDTKVSSSNVGWHLDHSLKVINSICTVLPKSDPKEYSPKFTPAKALVMGTGYIPKGRARAPKATTAATTSEYELILQLKNARENTALLDTTPKNAFFIHPIFGHLNTPSTKKFFYIHTNHHLKIIKDILKS
ncbi:MAG: hypothetical protein H6600_06895 [Flavobacteriales bacterium]|nr:hypothetical protein [Flavobacteriales bacterium]